LLTFALQAFKLDPESLVLKFSGDGFNCGKKLKRVVMTVAIMGHDRDTDPESQFTVALIAGTEKYDLLKDGLTSFGQELKQLNEKGLVIGDKKIPVISCFCSDWKFAALVFGIGAANSNEFCLFCNCTKQQIDDLERKWTSTGNSSLKRNKLIPIDITRVLLDLLHLLLRITDVLFSCLIDDALILSV